MAYDEGLAQRIRDALPQRTKVEEKKMFGGIAFLVGGNMSCGIVKSDLMVRVGPDAYEESLQDHHALPMDFTGKPMRGYVYVAGDIDDDELEAWVGKGLAFARSLPAK